MRLAVPRQPDTASWPRQVAAGTVDVAVMTTAGGAILVAAAAIVVASGRRGEPHGWIDRFTESEVWMHPALAGASWSLQVAGRNWRSPGMRVAGIRRVDARTGRALGVRRMGVVLLLQIANQRITKVLTQPSLERAQARQLAANDEIERMRASRPNDDPEELARDAMAIRRRLGASSCTWMLPRMLARLAIEQLPALGSSQRQTLTHWLAGTALVLDR